MDWNGRYKKTPRVKSKKYRRGTMPIGTTTASIDSPVEKQEHLMVLLIVVVKLHSQIVLLMICKRYYKKLNLYCI